VLILGGAVSSEAVPMDVVGAASVRVLDLPVAKVCACVNMCISVIVDMYMCVCVIVSALLICVFLVFDMCVCMCEL